MIKKTIIYSLIISMTFILTSCAPFKGNGNEEVQRYEATFLELFDTMTKIIGYSKDEEEFTKYSQSIKDKLSYYHKLYDKYNTYEGINNIKTINDNAGKTPVKVEQEIIDLLLFSKEAYYLSDGKINIAMGSVLEIWHDYRTEGVEDPINAKLPPMELLEESAEHTNIEDIIVDEEASTVFLQDEKLRLDVGSIAKGYATEQVALALKQEGFISGMLSVGGNVRTIGVKADSKEKWNVAIQNPNLDDPEPNLYILAISDLSLVTSGDYERYYTVDNKRYHHLIDPVTLMPATYFRSVSIVCKDSGMADALTTTLFNMPYEEGFALVENLEDTEALWVLPNGEHLYSSNFEGLRSK